MANGALDEDEGLSKEVTRFLDKRVGIERSSTSTVYSILQDVLKKKKNLETEVSDFQRKNLFVAETHKGLSIISIRFHVEKGFFETASYYWTQKRKRIRRCAPFVF